jgi:hypothetical protein
MNSAIHEESQGTGLTFGKIFSLKKHAYFQFQFSNEKFVQTLFGCD